MIKKMWTKNEIKKVMDLWEKTSTESIAKELGRTRPQISYIATQLRKAGFKLARKRVVGRMASLLKEAIAEYNGKK